MQTPGKSPNPDTAKRQRREPAVIAGLGAVTGYGWGRQPLWEGLLSGEHAARQVPGFGVDGDELGWVTRVPESGDAEVSSAVYDRAIQESAREAVADATARGWQPGRRVGLLHAIVLGATYDWAQFYGEEGGRRGSRGFLRMIPSTPNLNIMAEHGFHGPAMSLMAACSSANAALITAQMWLETGYADDVVVVSSDLSAIPPIVQPFVKLGAAVTDTDPLDACRPFQVGSRGFGFGEASMAFVVSRGAARPYARILGGSMSNDAYHAISVAPTHEEILNCVYEALACSGVTPEDIALFNSHGSGTQQCDEAEIALLDKVFGNRPQAVAIKPLTGHCQGASGAVEIAAGLLGYEHGLTVSAPIISAEHHPRLVDGAVPGSDGLTLKLALGMGGNNSALVLAPA
ncbi:beta-ketoacyl synthase N-terminal-like domain-containing protein [Nocardia sp. NPDC048505]|uniref:beta-ketoacyl synthase N-terminal-like domain-containing protein n=1 Tax=Nocardia sp. NPDC048505 TaxID=3155756 RepID=UPI0033FD9058